MSSSKKRATAVKTGAAPISDTELNDEIVREYLKNHDDFLQRYPDMLDYLHISHATGSAVSLVERQVSVMRERNTGLRHQLKALTKNAHENDKLFTQTSALVLTLLEADSIEAIYRSFMTAMTEDFGVEQASMILYGEGSSEDCRIQTRESAKKEIGSLFRGHKPVCGTLRKEELQYLFPAGSAVGSAALVPLSNKNEKLGLIAVGSSDANRYHSKVGTLFLSHIADVIVILLSRLHFTTD